MYRVGILGAENSHADAFAKIFNTSKDENGNLLYPDIRVVAVGGRYPEANQKVYNDYGLEFLSEKPGDMLGRIDALMVTARDGKYHYSFAEPYIKAGLPAFIDKPFAVEGSEALALARLAKESGSPLVGGSSVRLVNDVSFLKDEAQKNKGKIHGGVISAPVNMHNEYSGFYFYASHLVETALTVFGYDPVAVSAYRCQDDITGILQYRDYNIVLSFLEGVYTYSGTIFTANGMISRPIDISDGYAHECAAFADMLRTGKQPHPTSELIRPVFVLNGLYESYGRQGVTIPLDFPDVI